MIDTTSSNKRESTCDRLLSHRQLACCQCYCGIPLHGKEMLIYNNMDPLLLAGHHGDISAMTFGKGSRPVLLCSASADYIIVWDVELCAKRTKEGKIASGTVIGTLLGEVVHLSFCFSDERVAACSGTTAYVLSAKKQEVISTLNGHLGPLTSAEFCPWNKDIVVTTSEDRTFKTGSSKMIENINFFGSLATSLLSVLFLEEDRQLITGSSDGQVWCFSLSVDYKCPLVTKMDLQKMEKRHQMHQEPVSHQAGDVTNKHPCRDNSWFCIGSSDGLYVVDLATSELVTALYFKGRLLAVWFLSFSFFLFF
uniref:WD repeat domain 27 n=1 Tax=Stegastes partitus TaxID=144197 RepID=A0A3B5BFV1_9TELE